MDFKLKIKGKAVIIHFRAYMYYYQTCFYSFDVKDEQLKQLCLYINWHKPKNPFRERAGKRNIPKNQVKSTYIVLRQRDQLSSTLIPNEPKNKNMHKMHMLASQVDGGSSLSQRVILLLGIGKGISVLCPTNKNEAGKLVLLPTRCYKVCY